MRHASLMHNVGFTHPFDRSGSVDATWLRLNPLPEDADLPPFFPLWLLCINQINRMSGTTAKSLLDFPTTYCTSVIAILYHHHDHHWQ